MVFGKAYGYNAILLRKKGKTLEHHAFSIAGMQENHRDTTAFY